MNGRDSSQGWGEGYQRRAGRDSCCSPSLTRVRGLDHRSFWILLQMYPLLRSLPSWLGLGGPQAGSQLPIIWPVKLIPMGSGKLGGQELGTRSHPGPECKICQMGVPNFWREGIRVSSLPCQSKPLVQACFNSSN